MTHDCFCYWFNCTTVAIGVTGMLPNQQFSPRGTFSDTSPLTSSMSQGSAFQSSMSHSRSTAGREREHPKVKPSISAPAKGGGTCIDILRLHYMSCNVYSLAIAVLQSRKPVPSGDVLNVLFDRLIVSNSTHNIMHAKDYTGFNIHSSIHGFISVV